MADNYFSQFENIDTYDAYDIDYIEGLYGTTVSELAETYKDEDVESFFWEYSGTKEEAERKQLGQKLKAADRSLKIMQMDVADQKTASEIALGKSNLITGDTSISNLLDEYSLAVDKTKSDLKIDKIKTGRRISALREEYVRDIYEQRRKYEVDKLKKEEEEGTVDSSVYTTDLLVDMATTDGWWLGEESLYGKTVSGLAGVGESLGLW